MEILHAAPDTSSFISLAEHQSHTPESFYSGPPILHHFSEGCRIVILDGELKATPALSGLRPSTATLEETNGSSSSDEAKEDKEVVIEGVNVWITSEKVLLFNPAAAIGVTIPYPTISLHAIQRLKLPNSSEEVQGLYMQISTGTEVEGADEDLEEDAISMTLVPAIIPQSEPQGEDALLADDKPSQTPTEMLFTALSACSNLHPDPIDAEGENQGGQQLGDSVLFQSGLIAPGNSSGGLPPAMPGSGGWITVDNMHEYFDEDGNWIGGEQTFLGPGAGTVRPWDEGDDNQAGNKEQDAGAEETKWRRTE